MNGWRFTVCGSLVAILLANTPALAQRASDQLIVRFARGVLQPPLGRTAGTIDEYSFSTPELRNSLVFEGVERLARLFPQFRSEDRFSRNLIGEPVLLDDLSEFYLASLRLGSGADADLRVRSITGVTYAGWPQLRRASSPFIPNDQLFVKQWGLHNDTAQALCSPYNAPPRVNDADINAPEAWSIEKGLNLSVRVGIIDSGIRASHFDFGGRVNPDSGKTFVPVVPPWAPSCDPLSLNESLSCDFDDPQMDPDDDLLHGTGVAGIVAATGDNSQGVAGVAWGITPIDIKIISSANTSASCLSARALDWARMRSIPILNMSYQGIGADAAERAAARNAFYLGQLLVAAAGNNNSLGLVYPAQYRNTVCAVGAYFANGRRWRDHLINNSESSAGSNYGPAMDIAAPGGRMIASTSWGTRCVDNAYYGLTPCSDGFSGTSSAAPVVSGVAALLLSKYKAKGVTGADEPLVGEDLYQTMILTARHPDRLAGVVFDDSAGYGHVRADSALKLLAPPRVVSHRPVGFLSVFTTDTVQRVLKNFNIPNSSNDSTYTIHRYVLRKTVVFAEPFLATPIAWVRSSGTFGLRDTVVYDKDEEVREGRIVSISPTGCTVETSVYKIIGVPPPYDWYPAPPVRTAVGMTLVGVPAGGGGASPEDAVPQKPPRGDVGTRPAVFALRQNQPNPAGVMTTIRFELPVEATLRLEVFDAQGRLVRTLASGRFPAGFHGIQWDHRADRGRPVGAGVYLYRIQAGTFRDQKKLVLLER